MQPGRRVREGVRLAVGETDLELEVAVVETDPRQRRGRWASSGGVAPVPAHSGEADAVRVGQQPAEDDAGDAASSGGRSDHAGVGVRVTQGLLCCY